MPNLKMTLLAGLLGAAFAAAPVSAQSVIEVATAAARVDRSDPDAVRAVQLDLQLLGFYAGPIDGIFGRLTYEAAVAAVAAANAEIEAESAARAAALMGTGDEGGDDSPAFFAADPGPETGTSAGVEITGPAPEAPTRTEAGSGAGVSTENGATASGDGGAGAGAEAGSGVSAVGSSATE